MRIPHIYFLAFCLRVVVGVMTAMAGFSALIYKPVKRGVQRRASSGLEAMVGKTGTAITDIAPRG